MTEISFPPPNFGYKKSTDELRKSVGERQCSSQRAYHVNWHNLPADYGLSGDENR